MCTCLSNALPLFLLYNANENSQFLLALFFFLLVGSHILSSTCSQWSPLLFFCCPRSLMAKSVCVCVCFWVLAACAALRTRRRTFFSGAKIAPCTERQTDGYTACRLSEREIVVSHSLPFSLHSSLALTFFLLAI